jgi:hypothetical protein
MSPVLTAVSSPVFEDAVLPPVSAFVVTSFEISALFVWVTVVSFEVWTFAVFSEELPFPDTLNSIVSAKAILADESTKIGRINIESNILFIFLEYKK